MPDTGLEASMSLSVADEVLQERLTPSIVLHKGVANDLCIWALLPHELHQEPAVPICIRVQCYHKASKSRAIWS